jgi:4-amino-4-deoxy-L-arabinose transferase-like glycosyltransferase
MSKAGVCAALRSLGVGLATALVMLATEPHMAMVWDECYTLGRQQRVRAWFEALWDPASFATLWQAPAPGVELMLPDTLIPPRRRNIGNRPDLLLHPQVVQWFWPFATEEPHGHPPFYALLGLAGDLLAPSWGDLPRARIGPILLFSFTAGAIFQFASRRWGTWAAAVAAGAWVLQPNLFGHGHYASYDAPLSALWVLAVLCFATAVAPQGGLAPGAIRWRWTGAFGLAAGCAAATKFTGWLLPAPFAVWLFLYRDRRAWATFGIGLLIAAVVVFLQIPPWWTDPVDGVARFLRSNLTRAETIPLYVQFLGKIYVTPRDSLPWYNTMVWTAIVTPVGFLIMGLVGFWSAVKRWRTEHAEALFAVHWAFFMVLRALPHTPGHDGVRQFLPAFGLLALLAGSGSKTIIDSSARWAKVAIAAALLEGAVSVAIMMPVPLSYFSPIVGGLPGAAALGMEPTYYWDALGPDARRWLGEHTYPGQTYEFAWYTHSWMYLRRTGELPPGLYRFDPGEQVWYVLQNRPGAFSEADRALVASSRPAYTVEKLGVPLVWIFPYRDYARFRRPPDRDGGAHARSDR